MVLEFEDFVSSRAREYAKAKRLNRYNGEEWDFYVDHVEFNDEYIYVYIEENIRYDCPERKEIELTLDQLEMNDSDWTKYLNNIKKELRLKNEEISKRIKAEELKEKKELLERLKRELKDNK